MARFIPLLGRFDSGTRYQLGGTVRAPRIGRKLIRYCCKDSEGVCEKPCEIILISPQQCDKCAGDYELEYRLVKKTCRKPKEK